MKNDGLWRVQLPRKRWWPTCRQHLGARWTLLIALSLTSVLPAFALGKKKAQIQHAPLPEKLMVAKSVYIQNETNEPSVADKAYTQLKHWGRYQIVDSKEKADVLLVFTLSYSHTQREDSDYVSLYNYQTGAYTSGNVPAGTSTVTWTFTQIQVVDPKTSDVLWADKRPWLRKHPATDEVMKDFRERVEEQSLQDVKTGDTK